jgi:hypothetical protein
MSSNARRLLFGLSACSVLSLSVLTLSPALAQQGNTPAGGFRPIPDANGPAAVPAKPAAPRAQTPAKPAANAAPVRGSENAGRYNLFRDDHKDTGCLVTLDDKARGPSGTLKAVLAPACRDQGLVIFDPVGWHFERNRLGLLARKGHFAYFDLEPDGYWRRDPKEGGKPLYLRKL